MNDTLEQVQLNALRLRLLELRLAGGIAASLPGRGPRLGLLRDCLHRMPPERAVDDLEAFEAMVALLYDRGAKTDQVTAIISRQRLDHGALKGDAPPAETVAAWLLTAGVLR